MFLFTEIASDGLKGRVFEVSLADLQNDEVAFRKFKLMAEEVQGRNVLTNFHGMSLTTDKLRSMVKKWQVCSSIHYGVDVLYYIFFYVLLISLALFHLNKIWFHPLFLNSFDNYCYICACTCKLRIARSKAIMKGIKWHNKLFFDLYHIWWLVMVEAISS